MNADEFRDYMLSFLFLRYLSSNYETAAKKALGRDYPNLPGADPAFEKQMRRKMHYVVHPEYLRNHITELARMNMPLHGEKDSEFHIHHGDTLRNDWDMLHEMNPAKKMHCDAMVANPSFSYRWEPNDALGERFQLQKIRPCAKDSGGLRLFAARLPLPGGTRRHGDYSAPRVLCSLCSLRLVTACCQTHEFLPTLAPWAPVDSISAALAHGRK